MGFEFSNSIKRGGASCCEVVYMGCEFEIILKNDTQYQCVWEGVKGERNEELCVVGIEVMISIGRGNEFAEWGGVKNEQQRTEY